MKTDHSQRSFATVSETVSERLESVSRNSGELRRILFKTTAKPHNFNPNESVLSSDPDYWLQNPIAIRV